ncbi:predicted protein [Streptomyces viridochromogenes DSM 40736]|uniref:Predicted protein n=1 Tax=Streptomyces viridochromogenes (strain DSM 40736 / JCM 4977 / BCRC 1201 / Tue 494) TaxID=591159 RepID=D9X429_STRVT|nr:predicted protein [Streptomyces viridochromogenes DSM 40736]
MLWGYPLLEELGGVPGVATGRTLPVGALGVLSGEEKPVARCGPGTAGCPRPASTVARWVADFIQSGSRGNIAMVGEARRLRTSPRRHAVPWRPVLSAVLWPGLPEA